MLRIKYLKMIPIATAILAFAFVGPVSAQVLVPTLGVSLGTANLSTNAGPGSQNAVLASVRLDTTSSSDAIRLNSIPLILSTGNGAIGSSLSSCRLMNSNNAGVALNSGNNVPVAMVSGLNVINLDSPLVLPANTVNTLNLECNILPSAVTGGTFQFSLNTNDVVATAVSSGLPARVVVGTGAPVFTPVPGIPNTGAGAEAPLNMTLILGSLIAAVLGVMYVRKTVR